ncbi:hypothetical protein JKF63_03245 [Porcisia hertigi]|uniref:Uncharacterized protein n=1 Tax=Porcisia hertigi TaxID=2761500 RepID=A0A836HKA9_9TRYP|nr:hypothetical protein JKF63_03245 [Porcisia hertigi]
MPLDVTEADTAEVLSCASASLSQNVKEPGVFLLLNGLVCRTADASGRFRPSDIFAGVSREAEMPAPALPLANTRCGAPPGSPEDAKPSVDSDCPIFNCFGVLSGGVIIDSVNELLVDFTDSVVYTPQILTAHVDAARRDLQQANELAFRNGETQLIRPEYPLTLCSSEVPLPPRCSDPQLRRLHHCSNSSNAMASTAPAVTSLRHAAQVGMENVKRWSCQLAPHPDLSGQAPRNKAWMALWTDAEELRLSIRVCNDVRASRAIMYLPPRVPLPLRFRGQPISLPECVKNNSPADKNDPQPDREAGSLSAVPPDGVRCAVSSFTCYTGVPRFATSMDTAPRSDSADFASCMAVTRLRKRLRPHTETASLSGHWTSSDGDEEEKFLVPLTGTTPRHAAFTLFLMYFNHLGILCNGERVTGETAASSCVEGHNGRATTWGLCSANQYDVHAEVERKRRVTKELKENSGRNFPGGTRWSTTPRNRDRVAGAWAALLLSSRTALLERITVLNRYLHKLQEERQQQRQGEKQPHPLSKQRVDESCGGETP